MNEDEIIANMARELFEYKSENARLKQAIDSAHRCLICIGGPLNDNKLGFNSEQIKLFMEIDGYLRE